MPDFLELAIGNRAMPSTQSLPELETLIERGQRTFIEVGRALLEIHDRQLYCEAGYATFEAYGEGRWGWGTSRIHQMMDAAAVATAVEDTASTMVEAPANERQARAMLGRLDSEERKQIRAGKPTPETVRKMAEPAQAPRLDTAQDTRASTAPSRVGRGPVPGVGRAQKASPSKVMDRIFDQMRGMTLALNSCDCSTYEADPQELSDLTACIRALVRLRRHLEDHDHDQ